MPVVGSLPPTVNDSHGNPRGFWSIHVYQTDITQSAAPFITQASVLNTAYSTANLAVTAVDAVDRHHHGRAVLMGPAGREHTGPVRRRPRRSTASRRALPYYLADAPRRSTAAAYSFKVSTKWLQDLSAANVPIQGTTGNPGPTVDLTNPGGAVNLQWGPIQPVSQLGSQQLTSGRLARNTDGSVTIWIAPTLPAGAPATNWIPTPSAAYYADPLPGRHGADGDPAADAHLLPDPRKQHAGVDPASAERDRARALVRAPVRHLRVPGSRESELSR